MKLFFFVHVISSAKGFKHLELLGETLHVVLVELHDVFDEVLHGNGLHVVCKRKQPVSLPAEGGGQPRTATAHF